MTENFNPETQTYTLEEARVILREEECNRRGHDFEVVQNGKGEPSSILCARCGRLWKIAKDSEVITYGPDS